MNPYAEEDGKIQGYDNIIGVIMKPTTRGEDAEK